MYLAEELQADFGPTSKSTRFLYFACYGNASQYVGKFLPFFVKQNKHTCLYVTPLVSCVLCCEQVPDL